MLFLVGNYSSKKWYAVETYLKEADELTAIFVSSLKTMNKNF